MLSKSLLYHIPLWVICVVVIASCGGGGGGDNKSPVINSIDTSSTSVSKGASVTLTCSATDPDGDSLAFTWSADNGVLSSTSTQSVTWTAPNADGTYTITVKVSDGKGGEVTGTKSITVGTVIGGCSSLSPKVTSITISPGNATVTVGKTVSFSISIKYCDGSTSVILASVQWASSNPSVGIMDASSPGVFTANVAGTTTITASADGVTSNQATVLVTVDTGNIFVSSLPSGAKIYLDGQDTGFNTDYTLTNVAVGSHQLSATLSGYSTPATQTMTITKGQTAYAYFGFSTVTVSGFTYFAGTTIPVSGVTVSIGSSSNSTSSDGHYTLGASQGTQTITATKLGYDFYTRQINVPSAGLNYNIEITAGEIYSLSGYVRNSLGTGLYGATVTVLNPDGSSSKLVDTTDATGHYQIPNVPQGTRSVQYSFSGYDNKIESILNYNANKTYDVQLKASVLAPPNNLSCTPGTNVPEITLSWSPKSENSIKGYNLYQSTNDATGYVQINSSPITQTSYTKKGLNSSTTYYYKISSVNIEGFEGNLSNYINCTTDSRVVTFFQAPGIWPSGLVYDGSFLWCEAGVSQDAKIYRININPSIAVNSSIPSPTGYLTGLAYDGSSLWATDIGQPKIYKINPANGSVISTMPSPGTSPVALAFDGVYLWNSDNSGSSPRIYKINPSTGAYTFIKSPGGVTGITFVGGYLWASVWNDKTIYKLNSTDGSIISSFPSPGDSPNGLAFDGQYLWNADNDSGKIYKLYIADLIVSNPK